MRSFRFFVLAALACGPPPDASGPRAILERAIDQSGGAASLTAAPPDSLGQRGFRAERPGRPAVDLFVDSTGRLAHLALRVADPGGGAPVRQDARLSGDLVSGGIRWPAVLRLTMNGQPYFELRMRNLAVSSRVTDTLLAGPKQ